MKHYGDITKISGHDVPVVDVITGGSPCQDLSVAGKRAGLAGERSGLFMEQMRIVKEMRERDRCAGRTGWAVRPRYMVWENVPGAFSSGNPKGADFAAVIEEIIKVAEPGADVHVRVPDRGWPKSGCYYAEDGAWSLAWRVHDAQFWGVPQRRKRISLVADFGGMSAPEILFERKGLRGNPAESGTAGEGAAAGTESGAGSAEPILLESNQNHATIQTDGVSTALPASMGMGGGYVPMVAGSAISFHTMKPLANTLVLNDQGGAQMSISYDVTSTLREQMKHHEPLVMESVIPFDTTQITSPDNWSHPHPGDPMHPLAAGAHPPSIAFTQNQREEIRDAGREPRSDAVRGVYSIQGVGATSTVNGSNVFVNKDVCFTINTVDVHAVAFNQNHAVYDARGNGDGSLAPTITGDHQNRVTDYTALVSTYQDVTGTLNPGAHPGSYNGQDAYNDMLVTCFQNTGHGWWDKSDCGATVRTPSGGGAGEANIVAAVGCLNGTENNNVNGTLQAKSTGGIGVNFQNVCRTGSIVRRLTPLECERLQGFPDGWTDIGEWVDSKGKTHKDADSPRYKALGNSIALPFWCWLARRISAQYERPVTMASLFDGIGGFPLAFERSGGKAVWASEIEEFPIAVTKKRFPEERRRINAEDD